MIRQFAFALALTLLPGAAMAQHHEHGKKEAAAASADHKNFAQELIAAKADLKLTDDQIKKLEGFSVKMDEHHKKMEEHHKNMAAHHAAGHGAEKNAGAMKMEGDMHTSLLAIFTEEQLVKVRPLMKAHMEKCEHMKGAKKSELHKH